MAIPACFAAVFVPTYLIQRHLKNDSKGRALTFATILAVLAAIPTPITGTPVGLGFAGLDRAGQAVRQVAAEIAVPDSEGQPELCAPV